jgi:hypothetical protein
MGRRTHSSASEIPLKQKYRSNTSIDRFSECSLHADYLRDYKSSKCSYINNLIEYMFLVFNNIL